VRTPAITSFVFERPNDLTYLPGQYLQVIFDEKNRANTAINKLLSFSSTPGEQYIEITKRSSGSEFCQRLLALKPGDKVRMVGPKGDCVFCGEYKKIAFLSGGIGITPVVSIVGSIASKKLSTDVCLLYCTRTERDIAFKDTLDCLAKQNPNIKVVYTVDDEQPADNRISFGMIDKNFVLKHVPDYQERMFFIFGPPAMVKAMETICREIGCPPDKIKAENFAGY